ncbi:outer membrane transport energization protein ExbB [Paracoccus pantotrophus]|uniref:Biopolymer transport protein ExbB n=1 Tax=Paracoccus pantotrophus TaxID=82367 RepID=A0AAE6NZ47_PARPN|nr:tonB-system energizer ExbB [Paracoccus pantotrophus]QFG37998.1 tonB-system energizer ExbB [Paracoccus pantotrophus]RKS51514.1 outer membrane transport energization protein ExbB [Paracoccus pantotrophus]
MTQMSLPRRRAGTAVALTCLLLAAPISAQEAATEGQTSPAPEVQTQPAAPAGEPAAPEAAAPEAAAPATTTPTPAAETPAPAPAATAPEAPAQETPAPAPATDTPAAPSETAPAAIQTPAAPDAAATPGAPAPATPEAAEPAGSSILPQAVQDALSPMLNPPERDPNLPHDLSPMGMFLAADWVVKAVMIGLAFASIVTWTVLVAKLLELMGAMGRAQSGIRRVETAANLPSALAAAGNRNDPVSRMIRAAAAEYDRSVPALDQAGDTGVKERVDSHLDRIEAIAGRRMSRGTGVLATIGSTAPFVGLFGTVWGIMNSFIGISQAQTTNLAVVAPGIAEALLATALGLVAAIPAVVIYNVFARAITGYRLRLANAAAGVKRLVSRDLDFRGTPRTEV